MTGQRPRFLQPFLALQLQMRGQEGVPNIQILYVIRSKPKLENSLKIAKYDADQFSTSQKTREKCEKKITNLR